MSSQSEHWYFIKDGNVYYHFENDGYQAMRRGLEATDKCLGTIEEMKNSISVNKEERKYKANAEIIKTIQDYEKQTYSHPRAIDGFGD